MSSCVSCNGVVVLSMNTTPKLTAPIFFVIYVIPIGYVTTSNWLHYNFENKKEVKERTSHLETG